MFFPRLRRRAKWVFVLLAGAFALGFLAFGVGTGVQGGNIGDILANVFGSSGGSGPSIEDAQEKLAKNPRDVEALLELATAFGAARRVDDAIRTYGRYAELRPRDAGALRQLAALYDGQAQRAARRVSALQSDAQRQLFGQAVFGFPGASPLSAALGRDRIGESLAGEANARAAEATRQAQAIFRKEAGVYERLTKLLPDDPTVFFQLGFASQQGNDAAAAISAYERFLVLAPDDPLAPQVRQLLEQLGGTVQ